MFCARQGYGTGESAVRAVVLRCLFWLAFCLLLAGNPASAAAGERLVDLSATITIENNGNQSLDRYIQRLSIPAENIAQQTLLGIDFPYSEPYQTRSHRNGVDKYMEFTLPLPAHSKVERRVVFHLKLKPFDYEREPSPANTDSAESDRYFLIPTQYVESDAPQVERIAEHIKETYSSTEERLRAAYLYPQQRLRYKIIGDNRGALYALTNGVGDCTEYAAVFAATARAMGIPARLTSEFLFTKHHEFSEPNHHAAEVLLDGSWIPVDPNLALDPKLGYGFGLTASSKIVLKRDGSWVWANGMPGTTKSYRDNYIKVNVQWDVRDTPR